MPSTFITCATSFSALMSIVRSSSLNLLLPISLCTEKLPGISYSSLSN
jgi:hypothetical protein